MQNIYHGGKISHREFFIGLLLTFTVFLMVSCKKEKLNNSIAVKNATDGIPAFPLNWETADYMPTPSGTTILVPWANGSVKGFSSDIWYDYNISDGWALVYNVFNTSSLPANPWFALYNKYRGLLRIYVYVTTNGFTTSTYMTSGLNLAPNAVSSSMLNYIGQDIVNVTTNQPTISKAEPTQLATGAWYASQYEIAYDPKIATSTFQQLGLNWTLKWTSISQVSLGGTQQGTLNGTISTPATKFNLGNTLMNGALELTGLGILQANKGGASDFSQNTLGLPAKAFKAIQDGLTSGLQGVVKNLFNGIFGGSSANTQEVNLTLNTEIKLDGTLSENGAFIPDPGLGFGIPGISNSQSASGYIPLYNNPMGIYNLSSTPIINIHTIKTKITDETGTYYEYNNVYNVNASSINYLWNPTVINQQTTGATITNIQTQVVIVDPDLSPDPLIGGTIETVGSHTAITGSSVGITYKVPRAQPQNDFAAVRIIFKVVPNNGTAPSSTIVKTFLANIVPN
jgi:hypothetical protein